jgi:hypothetical protein
MPQRFGASGVSFHEIRPCVERNPRRLPATAPRLVARATPIRVSCAALRGNAPCIPLILVPDSKKDPPIPQSGAALPQSGPSLPDDDAPKSEKQPVVHAVPPPKGDVVVSLPIDRRAFDKYIVRGRTMRLMKRVIRAHVSRKTQRADVEDMVIRAQMECIEAVNRAKGPESWQKIDAWTSKVTAHAVAHHFRSTNIDKKWLNRDADVEEQPTEPPEDLYGEDKWMIRPWLEKATENDPRDRELLDILCYKARSKKPYKVVAAERGMTPTQLSSRVYDFKMKYLPALHARKEKERVLLLLLLFGGIAVALVVAFVVHFLLPWLDASKPPPPTIEPTPVPVMVPAPGPAPFNQAAPTNPPADAGDKPPIKP